MQSRSSLIAVAADKGAPVVTTTGGEMPNIAQHRTYTHASAKNSPEGWGMIEGKPEVVEAVWREVDAEMQKKGYELSENGDLIVRLAGGRRTYDKEPTGKAAAVGSPATEEVEGALVVDIFERGTGKQLFHGYAHGALPDDKPQPDQIRKALDKMFEDVPSRNPVAP